VQLGTSVPQIPIGTPAANWTPATVPNDPFDIATFDVSNVTAISVAAGIDLSEIAFNPGASSFTFNLPLNSPSASSSSFSAALVSLMIPR
jgi:hypothetical protein